MLPVSVLQEILKHKHLTDLILNNTNIMDQGIVFLQQLENLEYLNLHTTAITDAGLKNLSKLKKLKSIYVWQTKVTNQGIASLLKENPSILITK